MIRFMLPLVLICSLASAAPPLKIVQPRNEAHLGAMIRSYGGTFGVYGENAGKTVVLEKPYPPELLSVLKVSRVKQVVAHGINDNSFKYFAELPYLQDLSVQPHFDNINETPNKITNEALKTIQNARLRQLQVAWSEIDDDGLKYLSGQTKLEQLDLHGAEKVTDEGVKHLAGCKSLRRILLYGTRASGIGFPASVEEIVLTSPTVEGLTYLKQNCPNLKEIDIHTALEPENPSLTPEVIAVLKKDFTKTKIKWPTPR